VYILLLKCNMASTRGCSVPPPPKKKNIAQFCKHDECLKEMFFDSYVYICILYRLDIRRCHLNFINMLMLFSTTEVARK